MFVSGSAGSRRYVWWLLVDLVQPAGAAMVKPALSFAPAGLVILTHPLGSGPVAGWLTASTICRVGGGNVPDDPDDPDGDPDTELVAVPPPVADPE